MGLFKTLDTNSRTVGFQDLHSGLPFWLVADKLSAGHAALDEDLTADVVVIGGGITGALCSYAFSKAGIPNVVLDTRTICTGSTCASTALLQYEIDTPLHRLVELVGERDAVASYRLSVHAVERLKAIADEIGFVQFTSRQSIQYASRPSHAKRLQREFDVRRSHGLPVEFLDADAVGALLPFRPAAALRCDTAAETDPVAFAHTLFQESLRLGAVLHEHTTVVEVKEVKNGVELRTEKGHRIQAKYVVYATGYETVGNLPKDVVDLNSTYAQITAPMEAPWSDNLLLWETATPYLYMRTAPEGRVIIGGRDEPFRSPKLRDALLTKKTTALQRDFLKLFPDAAFKTEFSWCGTFGSTKDGLPYIDHAPHAPRCFYALGMGGNGITFSTLAAELIRDRILGRVVPEMDLFRFDR